MAPLLFLITCTWQAAAAPSTEEAAYRKVRAMSDRVNPKLTLAAAEAALLTARSNDSPWTCALRVLRAEMLAQTGKVSEASGILARPLPQRCAMSEAAVRRLSTLAFMDVDARNQPAAKTKIVEALALARKYQPAMYADVLISSANVLNADLGEANLRKAIDLARKEPKRPEVEVRAAAAFSRLLVGKRQYAEGIAYGQLALTGANQLGLSLTASRIAANLGWAFREIGDFENASTELALAEVETARLDLRPTRMTVLMQLGNVAILRHDAVEASRRYQQALDLAKSMNDETHTAFILSNLAILNIETGRYDQARSYNAAAKKLKTKLHDTASLLNSSLIDARLAIAVRDMKGAEATLKHVEADAEAPSTRWEAQALLARVYASTKRLHKADEQFHSAIRTAGVARRSIANSELRLSFTGLVIDLFAAYLDFLISNNRRVEALVAMETYRAQTLEEGLAVRATPRQLDPQAIAREAGATILCYWLGPIESYLWVVRPQGIELKRLQPTAKTNAAVDAYQRDLLSARGTFDFLRRRGEGLHRALIAPAGTIAPGSRVIIVPDGRLHAINFETLVVPAADASRKAHYWIEDVVLTTAGSLQLIARPEKPRSATPKILVVGNPPTADPTFPQLRFAADEITKVSTQFKTPKVLAAAKATPAAYMAAQPGSFDYLHFVAHGVATRQNPLDSAIILGRDGTKSYRLLARDIVKTPLAARLVTISSCYGAGSRNYAGEGLVGLAWAFLRAGADQVIAALWAVNDQATPDLMQQMYAGIRAGREPAVALREAKLRLVHSGTIRSKPSYWAPFVVYTGR